MTLGDEGTATAAYLISDSADESKTGTKKQNMSVKLLVSQLGFVKNNQQNQMHFQLYSYCPLHPAHWFLAPNKVEAKV